MCLCVCACGDQRAFCRSVSHTDRGHTADVHYFTFIRYAIWIERLWKRFINLILILRVRPGGLPWCQKNQAARRPLLACDLCCTTITCIFNQFWKQYFSIGMFYFYMRYNQHQLFYRRSDYDEIWCLSCGLIYIWLLVLELLSIMRICYVMDVLYKLITCESCLRTNIQNLNIMRHSKHGVQLYIFLTVTYPRTDRVNN